MRVIKLWAAVGVMAGVAVGVGAVYTLASAGAQGQKDPPPAKAGDAEAPLKKEMLEEARKVYELNVKQYQAGDGGLAAENLYVWSGRWLEAELDVAADAAARAAALKAHLDRMKDAEKLAAALWKAGQGRAADAAAGRYYRAQAELWLARGRVR
jgi:hypothetical protein